MRDLVGALELHGATVTADSMHCLKETAAAVRQAGAHYVLQVKKNQLNLLKNCEGHFAEVARRRRPGESAAQVDQHKDVDKAHGRIETSKVLVSNDLRGIADASQWAGLSAVVAILRERADAISGAVSQEISYFITSNGIATAKEIGELVRHHWHIEHRMHYSLDVTWGSNGHQVRNRTAAENFARLRRFCAGLVTAVVGWGMSAKRVRKRCGWNPDELLKVLAGEVMENERRRRPNRKGAKDEIPPAKRSAAASQNGPTWRQDWANAGAAPAPGCNFLGDAPTVISLSGRACVGRRPSG